MRLYAWYDHKGTLPYGDLQVIPEKVVQAFEVIRTTHRMMDKEDAEERRSKT